MTIIAHRSGIKTIRNIVEKMADEPKLYLVRNRRWRPSRPRSIDTLIRWGSTTSFPRASIVYNNAEAIALASNKAKCREFLFDNDIAVPEPTEDTPCIGRPSHHTRGRGFWYCKNRRQVRRAKRKGAVYFSAFYPKQVEYRVHVAHGRVLFISKKVSLGRSSELVWNKANGFSYYTVKQNNWPRKWVRLAIRAVKEVGLDFGAVDIMADPEDDELPSAVVCEINTAPSLAEYACSKYAQYFDWLLGVDFEREHLDNDRRLVFTERR